LSRKISKLKKTLRKESQEAVHIAVPSGDVLKQEIRFSCPYKTWARTHLSVSQTEIR